MGMDEGRWIIRFSNRREYKMVIVKFRDGEKMISGVLLGKYKRPHNEVYAVKKKFLWKTKTIWKSRTLTTSVYAIFIPWKHQEKELIEVDEKYIIDPDTIQIDEEWIHVDKFTSETNELYGNIGWKGSVDIHNFAGYKFMYDNNSFIMNLSCHEWYDALTVVYQHMPQLLNADLDNKEE